MLWSGYSGIFNLDFMRHAVDAPMRSEVDDQLSDR